MSHIHSLRRRIMRRVYYAFAIKFVTHPIAVHSFILAISVFALSRLTHVEAIMNNVRSVQVGELDTFVLNSLMHAEFVTLVCTGIVFFTLLSLPLRLSLPHGRSASMA